MSTTTKPPKAKPPKTGATITKSDLFKAISEERRKAFAAHVGGEKEFLARVDHVVAQTNNANLDKKPEAVRFGAVLLICRCGSKPTEADFAVQKETQEA